MVNELELRRKAARAENAERLLSNEMFQEVFQGTHAALDKVWKKSGWAETEKRENAYYVHCALEMLEKHFKDVILSGKTARQELERIENLRKAEKGR